MVDWLARSRSADVETERKAAPATHYRWRVVFPDGRELESCFVPEVTAAEVASEFPGCTAEPLPDKAVEVTP